MVVLNAVLPLVYDGEQLIAKSFIVYEIFVYKAVAIGTVLLLQIISSVYLTIGIYKI